MPISTPREWVERYRGDVDHFEHVLEHLIVPAVEKAGFDVKRPAASGADLIQAGIVKNLEEADLVLCDMSTLNANVFFELGIRTALDRPVCMIRDEFVTVPFDTSIVNYHEYSSALHAWELQQQIDGLATHVAASNAVEDNALWRYFGLTRRGRPATEAVGSDPEGQKLDLLLEEVQMLRRQQRPTTRAETQRGSPSVELQRRRDFSRKARDILSSDFHSLRYVDDRIVIYPSRAVTAGELERLHEAADDAGLGDRPLVILGVDVTE
jgi:hypothetical protein